MTVNSFMLIRSLRRLPIASRTLRRGLGLGMLLAGGGLSLAAAAYQGPKPGAVPDPPIQKVKDNLYVIGNADPLDRATFSGGNTAVFVTDKGVVLVDTKFPGWGRFILDRVKSVTDKPVTMIINTHTHNDHSGSNIEFPPTVEFVAHENTKANMSKLTCPPVTNCDAFKGENAKFLPKRTFKDRMSLLSGKDQIDLYHFGPGHTNGDTFVVFLALRTMHTGDMFARKRPPFIDVDNGGSGTAFPQTLAKAVAGIKGVDTVIPGHNPVMKWEDLVEYADFHREFVAVVQAGIKSGRSVDEVINTFQLPDRFKHYGAEPATVKNNVQIIYRELQRR